MDLEAIAELGQLCAGAALVIPLLPAFGYLAAGKDGAKFIWGSMCTVDIKDVFSVMGGINKPGYEEKIKLLAHKYHELFDPFKVSYEADSVKKQMPYKPIR